jgi:hypothetical protein
MHMVGHEAVRKDCKPFTGRGLPELLQRAFDVCRARESTLAI